MGNRPEESSEIYLREISQTPLLTPEEEIKLAGIMKNGTPEQGAKAREQMICANLRLVVKIAQDYSQYGLPLIDLISEGNMGLMKAVERFDPSKGGKLSTYAVWWIKQFIKRALANQSKTIRLPVHVGGKISKVRRINILLTEELKREPTLDELSEEVGLSRHKLAMILQASYRTASLNDIAPSGYDDDSTEYGDIVRDEGAVDPLGGLIESEMLAILPELLNTLDERSRHIINVRFGLDGNSPMTLEDVGRQFGVTRERIRQLENGAMVELRKELLRRERSKPRITDDLKRSIALSQKGVLKSSKQASPTENISQWISPTDHHAYERNKRLLFQNNKIQTLKSRLLREKTGMSIKVFWNELDAIQFEGTDASAGDILKGIIRYSFRKSEGNIPRKITLRHLLDFFQKEAA